MSPATRVIDTDFVLPSRSIQTKFKRAQGVGDQLSIPFDSFYQLGRL